MLTNLIWLLYAMDVVRVLGALLTVSLVSSVIISGIAVIAYCIHTADWEKDTRSKIATWFKPLLRTSITSAVLLIIIPSPATLKLMASAYVGSVVVSDERVQALGADGATTLTKALKLLNTHLDSKLKDTTK